MFYISMNNVGFNIIKFNPIKFKSTQVSTPQVRGVTQDTFTPSAENVARTNFEKLFPNGSINQVYEKINKDFQIDNPAELKFVYDPKSLQGGGFCFKDNLIEMNLYDLMAYDKKIVGIKGNKRIPLVSPKEKLPLFVTEDIGKNFVKNNKLGFDKLVLEDVTPSEHRKYIIQKIAHECVHAKQHQILRETEGVGDKEILKAWTHLKPENLAEEEFLNQKVDKIYQASPWSKLPQPEVKYTKDSHVYSKSMSLLNAIRYYPPVTSPEYTTNALEREAFDVSAQYVRNIMV